MIEKKVLIIEYDPQTLSPFAMVVKHLTINEDELNDYIKEAHGAFERNVVIINVSDGRWCNSHQQRFGDFEWNPCTNINDFNPATG